jgi:hypothetical protein
MMMVTWIHDDPIVNAPLNGRLQAQYKEPDQALKDA